MGVPIFNANSIPLNQNSGTMPDLSDALLNWFQPMTFTTVAKVIDGIFQVIETPTTVNFLGMWQPSQPTNLEIKMQGERKWNWWTVHAQVGVPLSPDDVVTYLGVQYRVMSKTDYTLENYIEYRLVNDYSGSGP